MKTLPENSINNNYVSILIPCFNGSKFINKCVQSCVDQTFKNIEIIIVNDGSTDNSENIIKEWIKKDSRIKYFNQENKGLAEARNVLISKVKTEFFFFLDCDDWIEKNAIEIYLAHSLNKDMVINSSFISNGKKTKVYYITNKIKKEYDSNKYLINNTPYAWGILFRTEYIKNNNFSFNGLDPFFEDAGVMTYWIYKTKKISFINDPKYVYFYNKKSLSHSTISEKKIISAINQLTYLYKLLNNDKEIVKNKKWPKSINSQLVLYHCVIFTYIEFISKLPKTKKQKYKIELKNLEKNNLKLRFPKRYWKFWYFVLYRLFWY